LLYLHADGDDSDGVGVRFAKDGAEAVDLLRFVEGSDAVEHLAPNEEKGREAIKGTHMPQGTRARGGEGERSKNKN
jgi:hypothetical protein